MRAEDHVLRLQELLYDQDNEPRGYIGYHTWEAAGCPDGWLVRYLGDWVPSEELSRHEGRA